MKKAFENIFSMHRLQTRLTALVLAIAVPVLIVVVTLVIVRAGNQMDQDAGDHLRLTNSTLATNTSTWLDLNVRALKELVSLPDMVSMDPARQKTLLKAMQAAYPEMYLISTTDLIGMNLARNDDAAPINYSDRQWFSGAKAGAPITFQSLIGRTSKQPALVASMPIRDSTSQIVGVGMFAMELTQLSEKTRASTVGKTGFTYVVDDTNQLIAHPDSKLTAEKLRDYSQEPPVVALRNGTTGLTAFTDSSGLRWRAYIDKLENGWGVVVQQQEAEVLDAVYTFQRIALLMLLGGAALLLILSWLIIRQALRPIGSLTETALAISAGDLTRVAPVQSTDEVGTLARTFNHMTTQLREFIATLEQRVAARTRDLQINADVSKQITTVLDINELLQRVTSLTAKNFDFYSTFVFLMDESTRILTRAAGANAAGEPLELSKMADIPLVAEPSIIARAARSRQAVTINDVSKSSVYMPIPSLPETRSEMAIPMLAGDRLLGIFDVQSKVVDRFGEEDEPILTALAEQIAIAVRNAQLFAEAQTARKTAEQANRIKSQFLANMSHELRTPLNAILNFTGFVSDGVLGPVTDEQADALKKTMDSGQHLLSLINDILDLTKIEVGMMDLFIQDVDINSALTGVLATTKGLLKNKPVELITEIDERLPEISGDRRRIRQVLLNVLSNAARFTEKGSITVTAKKEDDKIHITVRDTGVGIAPADQSLVFESFRQANHELNEGSGTGLGMPISKYFTEAHGGKIWFESKQGVGTTFHIVLPIQTQLAKTADMPRV